MINDSSPQRRQTRASACLVCEHTACCSHLPVHSFTVKTREDWETVVLIGAAPGFRVGLRENGTWMIFWASTCRYLDRHRRCTIHGHSLQPKICREYSANRCWYRRAFSAAGSLSFIRFTPESLARVAAEVTFDANGLLDRTPAWDEMLAWSRETEPAYLVATERAKWSVANNETNFAHRVMLMPPGRPRKPEHLDIARFRLAFPGVRLLASPSGWAYAFGGEPVTGWTELSALDPFGTGANLKSGRLISYEEVDQLIPDERGDGRDAPLVGTPGPLVHEKLLYFE